MKTQAVTVRESDEGEQRWFCGGGLQTWKATESETGGAFLMFEDLEDAGKVTVLHRHPGADETLYILEGEIVLYVDGEKRPLHAGGIAIIPRGIPHAFMVTSTQMRMLCLQTPGGGEAFYRHASNPAIPGEAPPPIDLDRVREAAAMEPGAVEILGPPPF